MSTEKRVLITGAAGFVGSHLVEHLLSRGYQHVFGTAVNPDSWLTNTLGENAKFLDLTDQKAVSHLVETVQPDWVIHLAGIANVGGSFENAWNVLETNLKLQFVMLEAVRAHSPSARVLSISSAAVYGDAVLTAGDQVPEATLPLPDNPYALSKLNQENLGHAYRRSYGLDIVTVRPFNQVGSRQTTAFAIPAFAAQIVQVERGLQSSIKVGNLEAIRDFTNVRDAAEAYEILLEHGHAGEVYNLGSGTGNKMRDVLESLIALSGKKIPVEIDATRFRPVDVPRFVADNQKLRELGWELHTSLEKSLQQALEHERNKENQ